MINSKITFNDFQPRFFFTSVGLNVWLRIHEKKSLRGRNLKLYIHFCFSELAEGEKKHNNKPLVESFSASRRSMPMGIVKGI